MAAVGPADGSHVLTVAWFFECDGRRPTVRTSRLLRDRYPDERIERRSASERRPASKRGL
jgi:hypothetical protein